NEIVFLHRPHVLDVESNKGLSFAGRGYELNLQPCGLVHLYNSSQISGAKAMLWQVSVKDYCVEKLVFHSVSPGKAVTNSGTSLSNRTIQTVNTLADLPDGPFKVPRISYFWPYGLSLPGSASPESASP